MAEMHSGLGETVTPEKQALFDAGHRFEAMARPLAEEIIGEELYAVTGTDDSDRFSASFDGLTLMNDIAFEHKTLNDELRETCKDNASGYLLPLQYRVQMEQQLLVSGADKCLFMATKWNSDELAESRYTWYYADAVLREQLIAGWAQFEQDLAAYVPPVAAEIVMATPVESLPAVSVRMEGAIAVISNLDIFGVKLNAFVEKLDMKPSTDQAFADAESAIKTLGAAEDALEQSENAALAQAAPVEAMRRTVADYKNIARTARLLLEKVVKQRKEQIKVEIVEEGRKALADHVAALNARLGKPYMPATVADFAGAIKNKRTVDSLRDAMTTLLANTKIEASATADRIQINLTTLRELASAHAFLFADTAQIVLKQPDDCAALVKNRIAEHQVAEAKRLEAEREKIRAEEAARLEREQKAKAEAEARQKQADEARAAREREASEALAAQQREAQAKAEREAAEALAAQQRAAAPAPIAQPVAAPAPAPAVRLVAPVAAPAAAPAPAESFTVRLGDIQKLIAPYSITAEGLAQEGFTAHIERGLKLYRPSDVSAICLKASKHFAAKAEQQMEAA